MKRFVALLKPYKGWFALALVALTLASLFNAALTGLVTSLTDDVMTAQPAQIESRADQIFGYREKLADLERWLEDVGVPIKALRRQAEEASPLNPLPWALMALIVFSCQALFDFIGVYTMGRIGLNVVVSLRQQMIDRALFMPLRFFKEYSTGEMLTRVNTDVQRVQQAVSVKTGELVKEAANTVVFLNLAFYMNWRLSLTLFVLLPLIGAPIAVFTRKIRKNASKSQTFLGQMTSHLKEVLVGMRIVKGFQKEAFESKKLARQNRDFLKYAVRELRIVAMTTPVMGVIGMATIVSFVFYGSLMIQRGEMTQGDFLFYLLIIYSLYQPIKRIARANSEIQQAVGVLPRILEVLEWRNDIEEPARPTRFEGYPKIDKIQFENLSFAYDRNRKEAVALSNIDFAAEAGAVTALVGPSGSGKTTLVNLLPRFYDASSGAIKINGVDVRDMAKADLRALIAIVTQETILFNDTVHNNIAYGLTDTPRERVVEAAKQAFAHPFIEEMAQGYDTLIGEAGGNLSGGQRQRISIARAILKNAPILILDEATSALDTESEREVQMALENLMKTKTAFVIAHRLSTIRQADDIVVLHEGRVVERGAHEALMAKQGFYKKLIRMQEEGVRAL